MVLTAWRTRKYSLLQSCTCSTQHTGNVRTCRSLVSLLPVVVTERWYPHSAHLANDEPVRPVFSVYQTHSLSPVVLTNQRHERLCHQLLSNNIGAACISAFWLDGGFVSSKFRCGSSKAGEYLLLRACFHDSSEILLKLPQTASHTLRNCDCRHATKLRHLPALLHAHYQSIPNVILRALKRVRHMV